MDRKIVDNIKNLITENVRLLLNTKEFKEQLASQQVQDNDCIFINNSFILRKPLIKTKKNNQFVMLKIKNNEPDYSQVYIATPTDFNGDFKIIGSKQASSITSSKIDQAIENEISHLGHLIFFLIGEVVENSISVEIQNHSVRELKFNPKSSRPEILEANNEKTIVVNQLSDPGATWNVLKPELETIPNINLDALEQAYAQSFERIQNEARLTMNFPKSSSPRISNSFVEHLRNSVIEQRKLYEIALDKCVKGEDENDINLREIMRISYNFADDAIKLMQLLVSVSDLKAVILWTTLKSHFDLAESIRNLPWTKSEKKASPDYYVEKIKGARNHAFHNLLLFDRTIEADLSGIQVNAKKLTILPLYAQRKNNVPLDYEDREIVEILSEITRATETVVTLDFWIKNLTVIKSFEMLLQSTENALWLLNSATSDIDSGIS
jgi:hypothetical protein